MSKEEVFSDIGERVELYAESFHIPEEIRTDLVFLIQEMPKVVKDLESTITPEEDLADHISDKMYRLDSCLDFLEVKIDDLMEIVNGDHRFLEVSLFRKQLKNFIELYDEIGNIKGLETFVNGVRDFIEAANIFIYRDLVPLYAFSDLCQHIICALDSSQKCNVIHLKTRKRGFELIINDICIEVKEFIKSLGYVLMYYSTPQKKIAIAKEEFENLLIDLKRHNIQIPVFKKRIIEKILEFFLDFREATSKPKELDQINAILFIIKIFILDGENSEINSLQSQTKEKIEHTD